MRLKKTLQILTLIIISCNLGFAQGLKDLSVTQKKAAAATLDKLLNDYINTCSLQKVGTQNISEEQAVAFLALFQPGAKVWDDLTPVNYSNKQLSTGESSVEKMVANYKEFFPMGIINKIERTNINYKNISNHTAQIVIQRSISGNYNIKSFLSNQGTVMQLNVKLSDDYSSAKITGITKIVCNPIPCPSCPKPYNVAGVVAAATTFSDSDKDGVEDTKDLCPTVPGPDRTHGCPDKDNDGIEDTKDKCPDVAGVEKFGGCPDTLPKYPPRVSIAFNVIGGLNSSKMDTPDLTKLNYTGINVANSSIDNFAAKGKTAIALGLDADIMFKKDKKFGVGLGVLYRHSSATMGYDKLYLEYQKINPLFNTGYQDFTRQFTATNVSEKVSMNNVAFNLLFKYDGGKTKKGLYFQIGPTFVLSSNATSSYTIEKADYESVGKDGIYSITRTSAATETNSSASVTDYFNKWGTQYDAGIDKAPEGKSDKFKFKGGIGLIARVGASIPLSPKMNLLAGLDITYLKMSGNSKNGEALTDNVGDYNTVLYGIDKITNTSYGIHIGIAYRMYNLNKEKVSYGKK